MTSAAANQFGDTTYTKVFVGGLAWETQKETMKKYFDQFGDILEAVVITDKSTGRSKGYGFVTFREAEAAMKSCVDAAPVIDGRRANCNLASLGVQRSKPSTPNNKHTQGGGVGEKKWYKIMSSTFQTGGVEGAAAFASQTNFPPHYAFHHQQPAFPYNVYGYPQYSSDYTNYPTTNYYSMYGGGATTGQQQYPAYYGAAATTGLGGMMNGAAAAFYPNNYLSQYDSVVPSSAAYTTSAAGGYGGYGGGFPFPNQHHHTAAYPYSTGATAVGTYPHHHYAAPMSFAASPAGVKMALHASIPYR